MYITSILSKKNFLTPCINLKSYPFNKKTNQLGVSKSTGNFESAGEKAIIIDMFDSAKKSRKGKSTYTIQDGDDKRLNKDGVIRVYNLNEPIDIPVCNLLGKWKKSHIGVTLVAINGKWYAESGASEQLCINKRLAGW